MEGQLEWYCLDYWSDKLNLNIAELKQEVSEFITVMPHVMEFLEILLHSTKKVLLVTNAHRDSLNLKMDKTCLQGFFDDIISSHDYGVPKEDFNFWNKLQNGNSFNKERAILIDDSSSVLESARNFGIKYLLFVSKPDSNLPPRYSSDFDYIIDFRDIMSGL